MRTAVSKAASLHRLRWQAAFTTTAYQTSSPVFWQHVFVSDTAHDELVWRLKLDFELECPEKASAAYVPSYCVWPVISLSTTFIGLERGARVRRELRSSDVSPYVIWVRPWIVDRGSVLRRAFL